jgi:hypothetical protein
MNPRASTLSLLIWFAGGAGALLLTLYGCFASIMLDLGKPLDFFLALSLVLPFPSFLVGLRSMRCSAALLWLTFALLWLVRANIRPNPELNPVDALGALYLLPTVLVQVAVFLAPKKEVSVVGG